MSTLKVKVRALKDKGFEGTVEVPGLKTTKLARKDGTTVFTTRGALNSVARSLGKRLGATIKYDEPTAKAAKKSVKCASKKGTKCCKKTATPTSTPCCSQTTTPATTCCQQTQQ